jgi:hypothetical protein
MQGNIVERQVEQQSRYQTLIGSKSSLQACSPRKNIPGHGFCVFS